MRIELYLKSATDYTYIGDPYHGGHPQYIKIGHGPPVGHKISKELYSKRPPDEKENALIAMLKRIAGEENVEFKSYDVAKPLYAFRAYLLNVRETPAVRIGNRIIMTGNLNEITVEQLTKALKKELGRELGRNSIGRKP